MKGWKKAQGAISIFLVIILVPMMTVSSLFVDAGRVRLAKGVAEAASDLALNTALTDYDTMLKDMYGLFATSQSVDELFPKLEDYYRTCITSTGVDEDEADDYAKLLMQHLGMLTEEEPTADLLNMQLADITVEKVEDADLSNAVLMKKQVVDFMKYRAPINTGLNFLSSLQSFINLSKETNLVDKRKEYYEAQQTVMENAQQAWKAFNEYNKSGFINDDNYFITMRENLNGYKAKYQEIHTKTIKDLYDTQDYKVFNGKIRHFEQKTIEYDGNSCTMMMLYTNDAKTSKLTDYTEMTTYSKTNKATAENLKSALTDCHNAYDSVQKAMDNLLKSDDNTYPLQFVVQTNRRGLYTTYVSALETYYECYQRVMHAFYFKEDNAENTTEKLWDDESKSYASYKTELDNQFATFVGTVEAARKHSNITSELDKFENEIGNKTDITATNEEIVNIYKEINGYRATIVNAEQQMEIAAEYLRKVLEGVKTGGALDTAKKGWSTAANDNALSNSAMAKQDKAEIKDLGDQFKEEDIQKLITRCEKIIAGLTAQINEINKYTYAGTELCEINDYSTFKTVIGNKYGDETLKRITYDETQLDKQISDWWNEGVFTEGNVKIDWTTTQEAQVNFRYEPKLRFYTFLFTNFHKSVFDSEVPETTNESAEVSDKAKQTYEDTKSALSEGAKGEAKTSQTITVENQIKGQSGLPSEGKEGKTTSGSVETENTSAAKNTSASLSSMFSSLTNALVDFGTGLRDNLYFADYVMSMFSYDTIEKEAKYNALPNDVQKSYASVTTTPAPETAVPTSLTNNPINADNNYAYGGEVEYIIYGNTDTVNKVAAYGSIFAIRLGFNLVYAFTDSEIREGALAIATPLSAATLGIIPAPLIQAAIIIGVGIAESSIDLMCLREGMKVPLYKNKQTWNISFSNLMKNLGKAALNLVVPVVNKAIDDGTKYLDSWLDKTEDQLKNMTQDEINKLGLSVEASFKSMIEKEAGIVMQKVTTLIENGIEEGVKDANEMVGYVNSRLDDWINTSSEDKSSLAYEVKKKAVDFFKAESGKYIVNVFDGIKTAMKNDAEKTTEDVCTTLNNLLTGVRGKMQDQVTGLVSDSLSKVKSEVQDAAHKGAAELKKAISENMNKMVSGTDSGVDANNMSSLIAFQYSDYLRLFLMIGLYTDEEGIILRTADVIQVNMAQKLTDNKNYRLSNAAVYVKIDTTVMVKPILIGLPIFADIENNPKDKTNWYTINLSEIRGY